MSTLTPAMEERVDRAIRWALTEPGEAHVARSERPPCKRKDAGADPAVGYSPGSVSARCLFCGAPGSRLCCDCDDLPALDLQAGTPMSEPDYIIRARPLRWFGWVWNITDHSDGDSIGTTLRGGFAVSLPRAKKTALRHVENAKRRKNWDWMSCDRLR